MPENRKSQKSKLDLAQVEDMASIGCTVNEIAAVFALSRAQRARLGKRFFQAMIRGHERGCAFVRRLAADMRDCKPPADYKNLIRRLEKQMGVSSDLIIQVYPETGHDLIIQVYPETGQAV
jgi:hypothetical protein